MKFREFFKKNEKVLVLVLFFIFAALAIIRTVSDRKVDANCEYVKPKDVALYLKEYHNLPSNYFTKEDMEVYIANGISRDGKIVGGNYYGNYEGNLSRFGIGENRSLCECDIYEEGYYADPSSRGEHRFVYTVDRNRVRVFETKDHYQTFKEITRFDIMWLHRVSQFLSYSHVAGCVLIYLWVYYPNVFTKKKSNKKEDTIEAEVVDIN